jgi:hypothetical protein
MRDLIDKTFLHVAPLHYRSRQIVIVAGDAVYLPPLMPLVYILPVPLH